MTCPACQSAETRAETTRQYGPMVMRHRRCEACDVRWSTQETVVIGSILAAETRSPAHASNDVDGLGADRQQTAGKPPAARLGTIGVRSGSLFPDSKHPDPDLSAENPVRRDQTRVGPADFLEFWRLYPKRVGRAAALRAWKRAKPPMDKVKATLAWQVQSKQWKEGFVPNPATWLNQGRWADERPGGAQLPFDPTKRRSII